MCRFVALGELKEKIDRSHCCDCWAPERAREAGRKRGLAARQRLLSRDLHRRPTVKALGTPEVLSHHDWN